MAKWIVSWVSFCVLGLVLTGAAEPATEAASIEFFEKKIRPVLAQYCYECHSQQAKKLKGGLYLDNREGLLRGGETGVAIVLGEPEKSRLIEAVRHTNPDFQMPPKTKLPDSAILDLSEWIKGGAPWPKEPVARFDGAPAESDEAGQKKREHWAWQPVRHYSPPAAKAESPVKNGIDRFILAALEKKGLAAVGPADRRTLIRRAYFDVIGLPPSAVEVEEFVGDPSPDAFAKVVDRLLANPHYGERFGRFWLDIARYGEDQAHSFQPRLYPQGFRYRDWLVWALNRDLPYDRFITEQIAGDLLEDGDHNERLAALGFFALGPVYYGDRKMYDQLDDRIDTLTRGFLGLTVACARCHDHKFDPVSMKDYYGLAGVFASSEYIEAPLAPQTVVDAYNRAQSAIQSKQKEIDDLLDREAARIAGSQLNQTAEYLIAVWKYQNEKRSNAKLSSESAANSAGLDGQTFEKWINYLGRDETKKRNEFAEWFKIVAKRDHDLSSDAGTLVRSRKAAESIEQFVVSLLNLRRALEEHQRAAETLVLEKDKLSVPKLDDSKAAFLDELIGKNGIFALPKSQVEKRLSEAAKSQLVEFRKELDQLKEKAPPKYPLAHSLTEARSARNLAMLVRGNPENPGDEVPRQFLSLLARDQSALFAKGSGRLELAGAIADPRNPLTARVMVNRIWQYHFGHGLVRTPSNFGILGEPPSHPELLDYLADQFIASGWSMKAMHRMMMLSSTYELSSRLDSRNQEADPDNRLWWRMNRRRLEVEAWRDAMLAVSGTLDPSLGGPSASLASVENRRRTFYAAISRHDLNSLLRLFDFPDPNVTSAQRTVTTVPLQQLFVLNSEFMISQAKALARVLSSGRSESDSQRIREAYQRVYSRLPSDLELRMGLDFLSKQRPASAESALNPWEQYAQVLLSANEFMYVD